MSGEDMTSDGLKAGEILMGKYALLKLLGTGAMGEVWLARDIALGREVAVKFPFGDLDPARFSREMQAMARVQHEHCVTVYDQGVGPRGSRFFVMEYVPGKGLDERIHVGALTAQDAIAVAKQVCGALAAIHAAGFVHRDLKPPNVRLATREAGVYVKVMDFGLAKLVAPSSPGLLERPLTRIGNTCGTIAYMSPEQIHARAIDGRTDLFALGVMLFEMLTGNVPVAMVRPDWESLKPIDLVLVQSQLPPVGRWLSARGIPKPLVAYIEQLLSRDPADRFASAQEALAALEGVQASIASVRHTSPPRERVREDRRTSLDQPRLDGASSPPVVQTRAFPVPSASMFGLVRPAWQRWAVISALSCLVVSGLVWAFVVPTSPITNSAPTDTTAVQRIEHHPPAPAGAPTVREPDPPTVVLVTMRRVGDPPTVRPFARRSLELVFVAVPSYTTATGGEEKPVKKELSPEERAARATSYRERGHKLRAQADKAGACKMYRACLQLTPEAKRAEMRARLLFDDYCQ